MIGAWLFAPSAGGGACFNPYKGFGVIGAAPLTLRYLVRLKCFNPYKGFGVIGAQVGSALAALSCVALFQSL